MRIQAEKVCRRRSMRKNGQHGRIDVLRKDGRIVITQPYGPRCIEKIKKPKGKLKNDVRVMLGLQKNKNRRTGDKLEIDDNGELREMGSRVASLLPKNELIERLIHHRILLTR